MFNTASILTPSPQNNQATAAQPSSLLGLYQEEWHKNNHPEILITAHYKGFHELDHGIPPDRGRELIPLLENKMMGGEANG